MRYRNKTNVSEEEVQISETVSVPLGDFDFVVEAFKFAGVDMEHRMSDQSVKAFDLLASEFHKSRDTDVNGGIKPFEPPFTCLICIGDLK